MAGLNCVAALGAEIATGTTIKTILELRAGANADLVIRGVEMGFKGVTATDAPILVELVRNDADGSGGSAVTPINEDPRVSGTIGATAKSGPAASANSAVLRTWEVHPQGGTVTYQFPPGERPVIQRSKGCALRVTAGVTVNCTAAILFEE